jgi:transcriptional regulator with XRE-family HTH domain
LSKKDEIFRLRFSEDYSINRIAETLNISKQYVSKILKENDEYRKQVKDKEIKAEQNASLVNRLFYEEKKTRKQIEDITGLTGARITQIIKENPQYTKEKQARKKSNIKNNDDRNIIKELLRLQSQNAIAMSIKAKISDRELVIRNLQHYTYNSKTRRLNFSEKVGCCPFDLPKSYKVDLY